METFPTSVAEVQFRSLTSDPARTLSLLKDFVTNKVSETDYLEFKCGQFKDDQHLKRMWSKILSAFANSDGGLVIWGILAKRNADDVDLAESIEYVQNVPQFRSRLDQLMHDSTNPPVPRVQIVEVIDPQCSPNRFVIVFIPPSPFRPHRADRSDNHYYLRIGSHSSPMTPAMLKLLFYPISRSKILLFVKPSAKPLSQIVTNNQVYGEMFVDAYLVNKGDKTARELTFSFTPRGLNPQFNHTEWAEIVGHNSNGRLAMQRPFHPGPDTYMHVVSIPTGHQGNIQSNKLSLPQGTPDFSIVTNLFCDDEPQTTSKIVFTAQELESGVMKNAWLEPVRQQ
jgi:hypothetical protein